MRTLVAATLLLLAIAGAFLAVATALPSPLGAWLATPGGIVFVAALALVGLAIALPGTAASILAYLRDDGNKVVERPELSYATDAMSLAWSHDFRARVLFDRDRHPLSGLGDPKSGEVVGGLKRYTCRFRNTGHGPIESLSIALRVQADPDSYLDSLRASSSSERIVEYRVQDPELGGPELHFDQKDDVNLEALCDFLNEGQTVEVSLVTVIAQGPIYYGSTRLQVGFKSKGLPAPVDCLWALDRNAAMVKRPQRGMVAQRHRGGLAEPIGRGVYWVSRGLRKPSEWLAWLAARLIYKREPPHHTRV